MSFLKYLCVFCLFYSLVSRAGLYHCPRNVSPLSNDYPVKVVVISESGTAVVSDDSIKIPLEIARTLLHVLGNDTPMIFFCGRAVSFAKLKKLLFAKDKSKLGENLAAKLIHVDDDRPILWQQDVFQTYHNPDGGVVIRQCEGYLPQNKGPSLSSLISALNNIGIKAVSGQAFSTQQAWLGGVGGNIEVISQNFGVVGTSEFTREKLMLFQQDVLPGINVGSMSTSWLPLGHIDEVLVPIGLTKTKDSCEASALVVDTNLALKLLADNLDLPFYDILRDGELPSSVELLQNGKRKATNRDVIQWINKSSDILKWNNIIQKEINESKKSLQELYKNDKKCVVNFIPVPALFLTTKFNNKGDKRINVLKQLAVSVLPSLTNGVLINGHYFLADPGNEAFRKSLSNTLHAMNLSVHFIPVTSLMHTGSSTDGFVHCVVNLIHSCEPIE